MATNQFLPFGAGAGANVMTAAEYSALPARTSGFQSGVAKSREVNTPIRQAAFVASMIGQFIADNTGQDVLDNADRAALEASFIAALNAVVNRQQSPNDATAGRALTVGNAFGIGAVNHLNQVDLDTVRTSGLYSQWNSSWATIASHYPVSGINGTGSLVVVSSGNGDIITQQYTTFADAQTYTRACALGTWGSWKRTVTSDEFTGSSKQLLADNGYQKLPGGLILQWGVQASAASGNTSAFFPIAFPGGTLAVFGTGLNTAGSIQAYVTLNSYTNGGATFNCFYAPSGTAPSLVSTVNGVSLRWFALGKA